MKAILVNAALAAGVMLVSTAVRADDECTSNPAGMGHDAAKLACDEIINNWVPYSGSLEKSCSQEDVIDCKNAMAQYLRHNDDCRHLVNTDDDASNTWYKWVTRTCNR